MITGIIICNKESENLKNDLINTFQFIDFESFNEDLYKEKKKAIIIKSSCGAKKSPFVSFYENKVLKKAFYSETNECTFDNILKYLYKYCIDNSKSGTIRVEKISDNPNPEIYKGFSVKGNTVNFGIGLPCIVEGPFSYIRTTPIMYIDKEKGLFKTKNSIYSYEFEYTNKPENKISLTGILMSIKPYNLKTPK